MIDFSLNKRKISFGELSIALFVLLSFTAHIITTIISSNLIFMILLFGIGLLLVFTNDRSSKFQNFTSISWLLILIIIIISTVRTVININYFTINVYVNIFVFFAGICMILFGSNDSKKYYLSMKIIIIAAVFYALSIWFQILLPSYYLSFLNRLSQESRDVILDGSRRSIYYTGLTANPGFTAGFIICGIILVFSKIRKERKKNFKDIFLLLFLTLSMLMLGRRAHTMFLLMSLIMIYILSNHAKNPIRRIIGVSLTLILMIVIVYVINNYFIEIPLVSRLNDTIDKLVTGKNIGSGRYKLYDYAWKLFLENLLFGIGWGNFRYVMIGNVDIQSGITGMNVHNVYLQLLCEMGIIGTIFILLPIFFMFYSTIKNVKQLKEKNRNGWFILLNYSFAYQLFFLLYGITGNSLYDSNFSLMYFFSCAINMSYIRFNRTADVSTSDFIEKHY